LIPQQTGWLIFLAYVVCRTLYFEARVERSSHNNLVIGTTNTVDLLLSGLTDRSRFITRVPKSGASRGEFCRGRS